MVANNNFLNADEAREIVEQYIEKEGSVRSTQEIIDSGAVPRLKGFHVRPGKVSDSIYGGSGSYKKDNKKVNFENPTLTSKDGKNVRLMVRTARISTHDILRGSIPFKDQILAVNHNYMRRMLIPFIGTSQLEIPGLADSSVVIAAEELKQLGFENVLRAYMAKSSTSTSLYQHYIKGGRDFCGHKLPEGLVTNGRLPYVMDTPSTKSEDHDESLSPQELVARGHCTIDQYIQCRNAALTAFGAVSQFLSKKGLIAVDTKTEHGINSRGEIVAQDEIWTMDSSRYWLTSNYAEQENLFREGKVKEINPTSYSKEFARGFSVDDKGYTQEQSIAIAVRYIEGIQHLTGRRFVPDMRSREERVVTGLQKIVDEAIAA